MGSRNIDLDCVPPARFCSHRPLLYDIVRAIGQIRLLEDTLRAERVENARLRSMVANKNGRDDLPDRSGNDLLAWRRKSMGDVEASNGPHQKFIQRHACSVSLYTLRQITTEGSDKHDLSVQRHVGRHKCFARVSHTRSVVTTIADEYNVRFFVL